MPRRRDRFQQLASAAAKEAIHQADLHGQVDDARVAVVISSAIGGLNTIETGFRTLIEQGPRKISPFYIPMMMSNGAAGLVGIDYGFRGPTFSVASACASGSDAIGLARLLIRNGLADAAVAGGSEATLSLFGVLPFDRTGALSRRNEDYSMTPAPFDKNRHGLVMGEGAAILILETGAHARQRGVVVLGEVAGYAATADAFHITAPDEQGPGAPLPFAWRWPSPDLSRRRWSTTSTPMAPARRSTTWPRRRDQGRLRCRRPTASPSGPPSR